ncbi:MAG TPA: stage V sporulation protein AC [Firmicutes bacterium]|nr:stage V sporulation protein AC [Candidatus Fermentithermobacillaceae bacterium]
MTRPRTREKEEYIKLATSFHPPRPILRNALLAFLVGGAICTVAQVILGVLSTKLPRVQAQAMTSSIMVFLGALLTGLGVYDEIGRFAGMGAALPITGFANSVVSPAMEFKREGFVLGVSARMFQVAGPVIVYGSLSALIVTILRVYVFG